MKSPRNNGLDSIVFFDGICNLCNFFIDFLIRHDRRNRLRFAPLQGTTYKQVDQSLTPQALSSVVFLHQGKFYSKSDAVLLILRELGWGWKILFIFKIAPKPLRNWVYDFIANHRYQWFGKKSTCRLPTEEERNKFLN